MAIYLYDSEFEEVHGAPYYETHDYVSVSQAKAFLKDEYYYYRRYVSKEYVKPQTAALIFGSAVDCLLTEGKREFKKKYTSEKLDRRTKVGKARHAELEELGITNLPSDVMADVEHIVKRVESQPFYKDMIKASKRPGKDLYMQPILTCDVTKTKGKLDILFVDHVNGHAIIFDLKTSETVDLRRYKYKIDDYSYTMQLANYKELVLSNFPNINKVSMYHIVVGKDKEMIHPIALFGFNELDFEIENEYAIFLSVASRIQTMKPEEYKETELTMGDVIEIQGHKVNSVDGFEDV
jgi:hypothetical protein